MTTTHVVYHIIFNTKNYKKTSSILFFYFIIIINIQLLFLITFVVTINCNMILYNCYIFVVFAIFVPATFMLLRYKFTTMSLLWYYYKRQYFPDILTWINNNFVVRMHFRWWDRSCRIKTYIWNGTIFLYFNSLGVGKTPNCIRVVEVFLA